MGTSFTNLDESAAINIATHPRYVDENGLFNVVFNEVSEAIILLSIDPEKDIPIINDINYHFEMITGHSFHSIRRKPLFDFLHKNTEQHIIYDALKNRKSAFINCNFICSNQQILKMNMTVRPYNGDKTASRFICVFRVTKDNIQLKDEAARDIKQKLLAAMHHNFKTPLNGILGYSEVIMSEMLGPIGKNTYKEYASDIHGAGKELLELIDSLLELKELETTEFELYEENIDLVDMLKDCVNKYKNAAIKKDVIVEVSYVLNFPDFKGDRTRLQKSIESVIDNALKFTSKGGKIVVGLSRDENGNCVISIKDNGKGMTPQEIAKAFSDDTQLDNIYSDPSTGIGFGISFVQKLIEKHGGSLSIISAPGEGTNVNLNLPENRLL
ncbi:sensor histidine kinase [Pseudemcibacter aquimaris]|uniref:sensor histidine kinase n=1 Tax=Pseudemcibacter aquimaris TaxID=2857064 RepID=UPI002010C97D|nr:HAMP domain-containing sensor histidine kinase [Pseudemcibacter aquimaris]MCC3861436.1 HAMP domain-containing histidine kinase [Pseudemcibacter aquimaris]WDU58205.1 HAMP domain-containing histidine kinase [Pseudemcibacter aquimaris]